MYVYNAKMKNEKAKPERENSKNFQELLYNFMPKQK